MESWISVIYCGMIMFIMLVVVILTSFVIVSAAAVVKCRDPVEIHRTLKVCEICHLNFIDFIRILLIFC